MVAAGPFTFTAGGDLNFSVDLAFDGAHIWVTVPIAIPRSQVFSVTALRAMIADSQMRRKP